MQDHGGKGMTLASPCYTPSGDWETDYQTVQKLKKIDFDMKLAYTKMVIQKFYIANKGKVYISFSGGKDSTVLLHIVRSIYPQVPAVYCDTGMEFPENRKFVKTFENVTFLKPPMTFKEVLDNYGYPCIGKNASHYISLAQRGLPSGLKQMEKDSKFGFKKFNFMIDAPFKVSEKCCNVMKKHPAKQYHKETGRCPIIGTRIEESRIREQTYVTYGENHTSAQIPISAPLSIWTSKDVERYIKNNNLALSDCYNRLKYQRTGCMFCMFGILSDKNRFVKLKATHPAIWRQCMKPRERGGLGMKPVLEYMGIPTGCEQSNLDQYRGA